MKYIYTAIIFLVLLTSSFAQTKNTTDFATINVDSAYSLIQANYLNPDFIILDVRQISEYNTKHIENGVELNYYASNFNDILDTLIKDKTYLIHCLSGGRSTNAFNSMQTMGFSNLYNMAGGINGWINAGYPITTDVKPIIVTISDTIIKFNNTIINETDTLQIKLTNFGNDTLKFLNITDISTSEFSINFDSTKTLTGFMDYSFNVIYSPTDIINDSIVLKIESNGGVLQYVLKGNSLNTDVLALTNTRINIFPNPTNQYLSIEFSKITENININVKDILGRSIISNKYEDSRNVIFEMPKKTGVYFVEILSKEKVLAVKKIIKL